MKASLRGGGALCPACGKEGKTFASYRGIDQDNPLLVEIFASKQVWRCPSCLHGFCFPPAEIDLLSKYYEDDYWKEESSSQKVKDLIKRLLPGFVARRLMNSRTLPPLTQGQIDLIVQYIEKHGGMTWLKNQGLLEIGAGGAAISTALLYRYKKAGLQLHVVEPSDKFSHHYRWYGIEKMADTLEEIAESYRYLIILASHLLEHVVDINETFAKISRMLLPSGLIFLEVPNCDDDYWQYRLSPNPPHLHFFTIKSLQKLMERFGFQVNFLKTCGPSMEWDRSVGFLKTDTPALISHADLEQLVRERRHRQQLHYQNLDAETRAATLAHGFASTYSNQGRQYIRAVATREK